MDEDKKVDWLDGQTMLIPVEEYVNIRLKFHQYEEDLKNERLRRFELEEALKEAKEQIKELLGINELEKVKLTELQFEKGVKQNDTV